jgi:hypothetical protein
MSGTRLGEVAMSRTKRHIIKKLLSKFNRRSNKAWRTSYNKALRRANKHIIGKAEEDTVFLKREELTIGNRYSSPRSI